MTCSLKRYVVELDGKRISQSFDCEHSNWLTARLNSIQFAEQLKKIGSSFFGIKVYVEYSPDSLLPKTERHYLLSGERMHTEQVLSALHEEYNILQSANKDFEVMKCEFENKEYHAVDQKYNSLYYFTAV